MLRPGATSGLKGRAQGRPLRALGTMSGTSLDGVDAAVLETDGISITGFGPSGYRAYTPQEREVLRAALGCWPGEAPVAAAAEIVETAHAELLAGFAGARAGGGSGGGVSDVGSGVNSAGEQAGAIELIGFHGQTLAHDPQGRGTHQAGDGRVLAEVLAPHLGCPVVWDFRGADVDLGGQGAPLAPAYHFALAKWIGAQTPLAFLNLGGVGNLTWVDPGCAVMEEPGAMLAFDTGPANAPVNDLMQKRRGVPFDEGGALAASGEVEASVLQGFATHRYFSMMPPKSLDRNDFDDLSASVAGLSDADGAATLTAAAAVSVVRGAEHFPRPVQRVLVTGGGRHNRVMMEMIREGLGCVVEPVEAVGLDGDMLEAQAFAFLAVRVARGLPTSFPGTTGVQAAVGGGDVSYPTGRIG